MKVYFPAHASIAIATVLCAVAAAIPSKLQAAVGDQIFKLKANDQAPVDAFGGRVATNGTAIAVGARSSKTGDIGTGAVYLFDSESGSQMSKLVPANAARNGVFGWSVDVSNKHVLAGGLRYDDKGFESGAAFLFEIATGQQVARLLASDGKSHDDFGQSVAIDGNFAAVGAYRDHRARPNSNGVGSVYVFDSETAQERYKIQPDDAEPFDGFGMSLAIDGTLALVGAPYYDFHGADSGKAYVFDLIDGELVTTLTAADAESDDLFGWSVAISGNKALVGTNQVNGAAYVFDITTGQQVMKFVSGDRADGFGRSVAIDNSIALVGADFAENNGRLSGTAYLFDIGSTRPLAQLLPRDGAEENYFGASGAISRGQAVVAALNDGGGNFEFSGAAYVFVAVPEPSSGTLALLFLIACHSRRSVRKSSLT